MIYAVFSVLALALLAFDQWSKAWTVANFAAPVAPAIYSTTDPARPFLPGVVELTRVHNYGAAWSSFSGQKWLLLGVSAVIVAVMAFFLLRRIVRHPLGVAGCTLIISGGIGNIIDRARFGYVVDMLHFEFWPSYPVFNVADICVVCGAVIAAAYYMWFYEKYDNREKNDGPSDAPTE